LVFVLSFTPFEGIILLMTLKLSFIKTTALFTGVFYLTGMLVFPLVPKAHALYWEDDTDGNDPNQVKTRPNHFSLFDWVGDAQKDAQKNDFRKIDNHDKGPGVNGGAKTGVLILSGIVGLGAGLVAAYEFTGSNDPNLTANMFIGGALGLCAGVAVGALIMPRSYEVDQRAQMDFMKQRQAWLQDPTRLQVQKAFHPTVAVVSFKF
jgi:hypothetical protein